MVKKLVVLIISFIVLLGIPTTSILIVNKPTTLAARTIQNFVNDIAEREEVEILKELLEEASISASLSEVTDKSANNNSLFENSKISGKIYFNFNEIYLSDFYLQADDVKISGDLYISEDEIFIEEDNHVKGKYGFNLNTFINDLDKSIFAPTSSSDYALDKYTYNDIVDYIDLITELKDVRKDLNKDVEKLYRELGQDIWKIAARTFKFKVNNEKVLIQDKLTNTRNITIIIDGESLANFVDQFIQYLKETDLIVNFLNKYEETLENFDLLDANESLAEIYQSILEEIEIEEILEEIKENAETIKINLYTAKLAAKLKKLEITVSEGDEQENLITLEVGEKGAKKTNQMRLLIDSYDIKYSINNGKRGKTDVNLEIVETLYSVDFLQCFNLSIDKRLKTYELQVIDNLDYSESDEYYHTTYTFKGVCDKTGSILKLSLDTIAYEYERKFSNRTINESTDIETDLEIVITAHDPMPKIVKDYKTIADITEEDINNWIESLENSVY